MEQLEIGEIIERFQYFDDWQERYRYLISLGVKLPPLDDALKTESSKVEGCLSQVWLVIDHANDEAIHFAADSDSAIVKGLIAVLLMLYSGRSPRDILTLDIESAFEDMGLQQHLSPNRRNGFYAMITHLKRLALQHVH